VCCVKRLSMETVWFRVKVSPLYPTQGPGGGGIKSFLTSSQSRYFSLSLVNTNTDIPWYMLTLECISCIWWMVEGFGRYYRSEHTLQFTSSLGVIICNPHIHTHTLFIRLASTVYWILHSHNPTNSLLCSFLLAGAPENERISTNQRPCYKLQFEVRLNAATNRILLRYPSAPFTSQPPLPPPFPRFSLPPPLQVSPSESPPVGTLYKVVFQAFIMHFNSVSYFAFIYILNFDKRCINCIYLHIYILHNLK